MNPQQLTNLLQREKGKDIPCVTVPSLYRMICGRRLHLLRRNRSDQRGQLGVTIFRWAAVNERQMILRKLPNMHPR